MGGPKKNTGVRLTREKTPEVKAPEVKQPDPVEEKPAEKTDPVAVEKPTEIVTPEPAEHPKFVVVDGKSLITKRGIRGPGDDITAKELAGGIEQLRHLYEEGFIEEPEEEDQG